MDQRERKEESTAAILNGRRVPMPTAKDTCQRGGQRHSKCVPRGIGTSKNSKEWEEKDGMGNGTIEREAEMGWREKPRIIERETVREQHGHI
jgi:hypothetical protein